MNTTTSMVQGNAFLRIKRVLQNRTASEIGELVAHSNLLVLDLVLDILAEKELKVKPDFDWEIDQAIDCEMEELLESSRIDG
jgi:hypothetical protein